LFAIGSEGFPNNPLSFGFNTAKQISLFLHVLTFRDLPVVKRIQKICHIIFSGNTINGEEEVNEGHDEAQKRATM
jgi:hypothetical protein